MKPEELVGLRFSDMLPDKECEYVMTAFETLSTACPAVTTEHIVVMPDGTPRWQEWVNQAYFDEDGTLREIQSVGRDITDRKETEEALHRSEDRFRHYFDNSLIGISITAPDHSWMEVNERFCQIMDLSKDELFDKKWEQICHVDDREADRSGFARMLDNQEDGFHLDKRFIREDGTVIFAFQAVKCVRKQDGSADYFLTLIEDITARKQSEQAIMEAIEREQRRIGQDLHDGLIQHLSGIRFMAQLLEKNIQEKDETLGKEAEKISELLNESVMQARHLAQGLYPTGLEADGIVSAMYQLAERTEMVYNIPCIFMLEPQNIEVQCLNLETETHLYRIAQEAIANAIKHGPCSQIDIDFSISEHEIIMRITDDGPGITDPSTKRASIGLSSMRYRAKMIGALLDIAKVPEGGTCVLCTLPVPESIEE